MASPAKTNWKRKDVIGGPTKSSSDEERSGGDSPRRNLQKRRSTQSSTVAQSKTKRGGGRSTPSPALKRRGENREKQPTASDSVRSYPKSTRSKSSSPDRANAAQSPHRKTPELPPYIRATIAEQLAPPRSRPAREDTKENLFGQGHVPKKNSSSARCHENTQNTLFGEPDPLLAAHKSSRQRADTKNNLFGPPPEIPVRPASRQRPDTPDIISHATQPHSGLRETQLKTIVSRYQLRHQDTHQKLFGAPETLRRPPPPKTTSNIFFHDEATHQDQAVRSLPLGSVIVVTRDVVQPPGPQEVSEN